MDKLWWSRVPEDSLGGALGCIFEAPMKNIEVFYVKDMRDTELDLSAEEKRARAKAEAINMIKRRRDGRPAAVVEGINLGRSSHAKDSESTTTPTTRENSNHSIDEASRKLCERLEEEDEAEHQMEMDILMKNRNFSNGTVGSDDGPDMDMD